MAISDDTGRDDDESGAERDDDGDGDDDESLVPLGAVLDEIQKRTTATAAETAMDVLKRARTPPSALDAERATLGALLLEPSSYEHVIDEGLRPEDFYRPAHGTLFKVIQDLHAAAEPIDVLTVVDELLRRGQLDAVGGAAAVSQLEAMLPTAAHVGAYARLVREKATLRSLIETATRIVQSAYHQDKRVVEIIDDAEREILKISEGHTKQGIVPMRELVERATKQLEKAFNNKSAITGVATGFRDLDMMTSGLQPGELIIVAARPSMGKCLAADSEIVLESGEVATIEELYRRRDARLLTLSDHWKLGWTSPSAFVDDGVKPVFKVTTRLGRVIETTASHPFRTLDGWHPLAELTMGARVAVPRLVDVHGTDEMPEHEVKLLAYLIGDGCLTDGAPEFTATRPALQDEYAQCCDALGVDIRRDEHGGRAPTFIARKRRDDVTGTRATIATRLTSAMAERGITGRAVAAALDVSAATVTHWRQAKTAPDAQSLERLAELVGLRIDDVAGTHGVRSSAPNALSELVRRHGLLGLRAQEKHVPSAIFRLRRALVRAFINRLFATDGWATVLASGQPQIGFSSTSERLARQVQHLLLRFGVIASLRRRMVKYARDGVDQERREAWQLDVTDARSLERFVDDIGIFGKEDAVASVKHALSRRKRQTNVDLVPVEVWSLLDKARGTESWAALAKRAGVASSNVHAHRRAMSRERLARFALALGDGELAALASSDVYWDEIVSIEPMGAKQVYDLTVDGTHNFVANDVCVHNTAFTLNVASHIATRVQKPVMFFSLEMGADQLVQRLIGSEARIDISNIRRGFIQRHEWSKLAEAAGRLSEAPFYIDETPSISVAEMRNKCRRQMHETGISCVIVDYLQLMQGPPGYDNKATEVGEISKGLKTLARELSIPVVALSQLNRGVESRTDKRPMMSDLRESGAIEQDADVIAFLYREEYYAKDKTPEDKLGIAEIIIAKHRNGPTGTVELRFFNNITRFDNLDRQHDDYAP